MSFEKFESIPSGTSFYSLKDKAFFHVCQRVFESYDRIDAKRNSVTDKEKFDHYQTDITKAFKDTMGNLPYDKSFPLDAKTTNVIKEDGLTIKNVIFSSRENVFVTANLYIPETDGKKCPAVLLQCGHSANGKASKAYQRAARIIASYGIVVLVTDPAGQGERVQYINENGEAEIKGPTQNHQMFGTQCFLNGESPVKYFLADALKAVDYLESLEETDSAKIGATGISGGGTMTSLLMAYDERIKAAAPGCWPSSGREYFISGGAADSEQIWPNVLKNDIDVFEIMAAFCPRPLMLLAAAYDFIPIEGVKRLFNETKRLYSLSQAENNIEISIANEMHGYSESLAISAGEFFAKNFFGKVSRNENISILPLEDEKLFATKSGFVLVDFPESLAVYQENIAEYNKKTPLSEEEKTKVLSNLVFNERSKDFEYNLRVLNADYFSFCHDGLFVQPYIWFTGEFLPCHGFMFKSEENKDKNIPVTICLWMDGTDNLSENEDKIREICKSGRSAFIPDLTAMGKCVPHKMKGDADIKAHLGSISDKIAKSLIMLGDSLCALKTYSLVQTINMARKEFSEDVKLYTKGNYSVFARIVQKLDKNINCTCDGEVKIKDIINNKYYETYDISHIIMPGIGDYIE